MIKSVKKAMDILTILSNTGETPITLGELASQTGLNKSTCSHIVDTMCESFYVERISRKDGYRLGPWSYMLSRYGGYRSSLVKIASPVLKWLRNRTGASVFISVVCNGRKYIVYHIDRDNLLPMSDCSIIQGYMESTATGRVLMAYMNSSSFNSALSHRTPEEREQLTSPEFKAMLKGIRTAGYTMVDVVSQNTKSYALPVFDADNKVIAALGILYHNDADTPEYREQLLKAGKTAANEISRRLAFE